MKIRILNGMMMHLRDKLHGTRKERRKKLESEEDRIDGAMQEHEEYVNKDKGRLFTAGTNSNIYMKRKKSKKNNNGKKKYVRQQTRDTAYELTMKWLRRGNLKRETESHNS